MTSTPKLSHACKEARPREPKGQPLSQTFCFPGYRLEEVSEVVVLWLDGAAQDPAAPADPPRQRCGGVRLQGTSGLSRAHLCRLRHLDGLSSGQRRLPSPR